MSHKTYGVWRKIGPSELDEGEVEGAASLHWLESGEVSADEEGVPKAESDDHQADHSSRDASYCPEDVDSWLELPE